MKVKTFDVRGEGSQEYAALTTYIIDYSTQIAIEKRPLILVCPGGGYSFTDSILQQAAKCRPQMQNGRHKAICS